MPVPMDVRKKIEQDLRLIESGEESYGSLAERYGVSKSTIFRMHIKKLRRLVDEAKEELKVLKQKKGRLQAGFEGLEEKYRRKNSQLNKRHEEKKEKLEREIEKLRQERKGVKEAFEKRGVTWEQGVQIVKDVSDLRGESSKLQNDLSELRGDVSNWKAKANQARSSSLQLKKQLSNLRGIVKKEEREFHYLMDKITSAQNDLYALEDEKRKLGETIKDFNEITLMHRIKEKRIALQGEVEQLKANVEKLMDHAEGLIKKIKRLKAGEEKFRSEREKRIKKAKELAEKIVADAEQEKKRILAGAEEERARVRGEIGTLNKEKEKALKEVQELEAEKKLIEVAVRMKIKELKEARKRLEVEEAEQDAGPLGLYIPKLPR